MINARMQRAANWVTVSLLWMVTHTVLAVPATTTHPDIDEFASRFITSFENLDLPGFMACFADDATVFFPVPEPPDLFVGKVAIQQQFRRVFDRIRASATSGPPYHHLVPENTHVQVLSPVSAVMTFQLQNAERVARRTLVLKKSHGQWLIAQLHASNVPIAPAR